jgi:hypothetical protein
MPIFEIQGPDGKTYEADAPDAQTAVKAFASLGRKAELDNWADAEVANVAEVAGTPMPSPASSIPGVGPWLDEASAGLDAAAHYVTGGRVGHEYEKALALQQARQRASEAAHPTASKVAGAAGLVGGALATPFVRVAGGAGAVPTAVNVGANAAAYGALDAAGAAEDSQRLEAAKEGGTQGAITGAILGGVLGKIASKAETPNLPPRIESDDLKQMGRAAYDAADQAGVVISQDALKQLSKAIGDDVTALGYKSELHPRITTALKDIEDLATMRTNAGSGRMVGLERWDAPNPSAPINATLKGLDQTRRVVQNAGDSLSKSERMLSGRIIERIDDFVDDLGRGSTVAGNAGQGARALTEARDFWHRASKTEKIEDLMVKAEDRAASTYSGGNQNNAMRQNLRRILDNPKLRRGYSATEIAKIRRVVHGTPDQNFMRWVGKASPEHGLMATALSGGAGAALATATAHPLFLTIPVAGFIAKRLADRGTAKAADQLLRAVSNGKAGAQLTKWGEAVTRFRDGHMSEAALKLATQALARQMARDSGDDEKTILDTLLEAVKGGQ